MDVKFHFCDANDIDNKNWDVRKPKFWSPCFARISSVAVKASIFQIFEFCIEMFPAFNITNSVPIIKAYH